MISKKCVKVKSNKNLDKFITAAFHQNRHHNRTSFTRTYCHIMRAAFKKAALKIQYCWIEGMRIFCCLCLMKYPCLNVSNNSNDDFQMH